MATFTLEGGLNEVVSESPDYPISDQEFAKRVARLRGALDDEGLDGIVLYGAHRNYQPADLRYFAGGTASRRKQLPSLCPVRVRLLSLLMLRGT